MTTVNSLYVTIQIWGLDRSSVLLKYMYLCTERVYNYKLMIILTVQAKAIRWKIALDCYDYFFHLILILITKHFN